MFAKDSKDLDISPFLFDAIAGCVGNGWTVQFKAYLSVYQNLDFTKILANPESVANNSLYDTEKRYAIIGGCTERILSVLKDKKLSADEKNKKLVQLVKVIVYLPSNLFVLAWKQIKAQGKVNEVMGVLAKNKDCFKLLQDRHATVLNKIVQ